MWRNERSSGTAEDKIAFHSREDVLLFESVNSCSDLQSKLLAGCSLLGRPGRYAAHSMLAGCDLFIFGREVYW